MKIKLLLFDVNERGYSSPIITALMLQYFGQCSTEKFYDYRNTVNFPTVQYLLHQRRTV